MVRRSGGERMCPLWVISGHRPIRDVRFASESIWTVRSAACGLTLTLGLTASPHAMWRSDFRMSALGH